MARKQKWIHTESRLRDAASTRAGMSGVSVDAAIIVAKRLGKNATYKELEDAMFSALGTIENKFPHVRSSLNR